MADAELLTKWQLKNKEYKQRHQLNAHRETDTMARLMKFRQNLQKPAKEKQAATASGGATATSDVTAVRPDAQGAPEPSNAAADKSQTEAAEEEVSAWRPFHVMDGTEQTPVVTLTHQQALSYAHICGQMLCLEGSVMQYAMYRMSGCMHRNCMDSCYNCCCASLQTYCALLYSCIVCTHHTGSHSGVHASDCSGGCLE